MLGAHWLIKNDYAKCISSVYVWALEHVTFGQE